MAEGVRETRDITFAGTHIYMSRCAVPKTRKTKIWTVRSSETGYFLGWVKWHAPWRRYAFYPHGDTLFEETCMREIAQFLEDATRRRKEDRNLESFRPDRAPALERQSST